MKKIIFVSLLLFAQISDACTGFGFITDSGTIIGRNRDYYYNPQQFQLMYPIQQFNNWYENNYHHNNKFYALTSMDNISMGVNQNGLTIIEENSPMPKNAEENRRFQQPENGTVEGMIKYGILQNFNTIDEMIPYLSKIFSVADPQFYQIADAKKILTVEVAFGDNNKEPKRKFTYKIIDKTGNYFAHTNLYLIPEYAEFNKLKSDVNSFNSATNRLDRITDLLSNAKISNMDSAISWLKDTHSNVNECLNTSLFRSDLQGFKSVDVNLGNDKIYGTVSSMVVSNNGDLDHSIVYLLMVDSITTDNNNKQLIKYRELRTSIANLFTKKPLFVEREMVRNLPVNGVCS